VIALKKGGPAFPVIIGHNAFGQPVYAQGMTLRDAIAIAALPSILAVQDGGIQSHGPRSHMSATSETRAGELWAEQAYQMADFMLAERAK